MTDTTPHGDRREALVHWKIRLSVTVTLLALSLIGMLITYFDDSHRFTWRYWLVMVPVFAGACFWMRWLDRKQKDRIRGTTVWHGILHWLAVLVVVCHVPIFIRTGLMGGIAAGLVVMTILALATFLAGIYLDSTFLVLGILLELMVIATALFIKYSLVITVPLIVASGLAVYLFYRHRRPHPSG